MPDRRRTLVLFGLAVLLPTLATAQTTQTPARRVLVPSTESADAAKAFEASVDAAHSWSWAVAFRESDRAMKIDSTFGIARAHRAVQRGGPALSSELNRAAVEAAAGSAGDAVIALAMRESNAGRGEAAAALYNVAMTLAPDDPRIALERALALPGGQRIAALREVSTRFPSHAPPKMWLAFYLTESAFEPVEPAAAAEALRVAQDALGLSPNASGSHTAIAHVLERSGRYDEAAMHLGHATKMSQPNEYAYVLKAEIAIRHGNTTAARSALDSAAMISPNIGRVGGNLRARATYPLYDGNLSQAVRELEALSRDDEAAGLRGRAQFAHFSLSFLAGTARNVQAVDRHLDEARRLGATGAGLASNMVVAYWLAGDAAKARSALNDYLREAQGDTTKDGRETLHRLTGMVLSAENHPGKAIAELKQAGSNPYTQLALVEAYRLAGDKVAATAEQKALFSRKEFGFASTAIPIGRYRLRAKGR